tara:strand:- start:49 stop:801 length:753 start_codon:yes stop_codon:yes gene_type:complete
MFKIILISILFTQGILFAHCDGCGADNHNNTHNQNGSLTGNVKYQGKVPSAKALKMDADPVCGSAHKAKVFSESFIVDDNLNLKNVLVWLKDVEYKGEIPSTPAILDQKGCIYDPHVLGVVKGQTLLIKNSDATLHNIHSMADKNDQFNFAMPKVVKEKETVFNISEDPFYIKCDVHPWMKSWVLVQDHPYFAVTDEKGNFKIENIPPGTYEVIAWQEKFKMKRSISKTIEVKASSETVQDFVFIKPEKK